MSVPPGPVPAEGPTTRSRRCSPIGRLRGRCGTGRSRYAAEVTERRGEERADAVAGRVDHVRVGVGSQLDTATAQSASSSRPPRTSDRILEAQRRRDRRI
jgi:hypothetical protein